MIARSRRLSASIGSFCDDRLTDLRHIQLIQEVKDDFDLLNPLKAFCGYLEYEELIKENPFSRLRLKLSAPLILPKTIPLSAIEAILTAAYQMKERSKTPGQRDVVLRDIAVLELLFATGVILNNIQHGYPLYTVWQGPLGYNQGHERAEDRDKRHRNDYDFPCGI